MHDLSCNVRGTYSTRASVFPDGISLRRITDEVVILRTCNCLCPPVSQAAQTGRLVGILWTRKCQRVLANCGEASNENLLQTSSSGCCVLVDGLLWIFRLCSVH